MVETQVSFDAENIWKEGVVAEIFSNVGILNDGVDPQALEFGRVPYSG